MKNARASLTGSIGGGTKPMAHYNTYLPHDAYSVGEKTKTKSKTVKAAKETKKKMLIQQRWCNTTEECSKTWRAWNDSTFAVVLQSFSSVFTDYQVVPVSSAQTLTLASEVAELYADAHVLVGLHGAGLTNMMFMSKGSLVVEIAGQFDGRMTPLCG